VARRGVEEERLAQLLDHPGRSRVLGHREAKNAASAVLDDEPDVHYPDRHHRDGEEVHGGDAGAVVAREGQPALDGGRLRKATR
jgi:hypothetical protein